MLRSPILTGRHEQRDYLALAQMAKRALKQVNGVLLQPRRGTFGKSVDGNWKKYCFSKTGSTFPEVSLPKWRALKPQAKKEGVKVGSAGSFVLAQGKPKRRANWIKPLGSAQYGVSQKIYNNRKPVLRPMRIPYAGSKILFFWFLNSSFCAAGDYGTS